MDIKVMNIEKDEPEKSIDMQRYIEKHDNQIQRPKDTSKTDGGEAKPADGSDELNEMKKQLKLLQAELEKQTMLREDALKRTLRKSSNSLRNRELSNCILVGIIAIGMPPLIYFTQHLHIWFCVATGVFFLFALAWEIFYFKKLHLGRIMHQDLLQAQKDLLKYRRYNEIWLYRIGIPFVFLWGAWYIYEQALSLGAFEGSHPWHFIANLTICCTIGGVVGGLIGYFTFYKPQMQLVSDIIQQIKELESED